MQPVAMETGSRRGDVCSVAAKDEEFGDILGQCDRHGIIYVWFHY